MSESSVDEGSFFSSRFFSEVGCDSDDGSNDCRIREDSKGFDAIDEDGFHNGNQEPKGLMCIFDFKGIKAGKNAQNNDCEQFHLNFLI